MAFSLAYWHNHEMPNDAANPLLFPLLPEGAVWQIQLVAGERGVSPLRRTPEALIYAVHLVDQTGRALEALELWVQRVEAEDPAQPGLWGGQEHRPLLDRRWEQLFRAFQNADGARLWVTGWETRSPAGWQCGDITINPGGGRFLLRKRSPLSGTEAFRLLSGQALTRALEPSLDLATAWKDTNDLRFGSGSLLSRLGPASRLQETLVLKLQFLGGLLRAARDFTASRQAPFLNLHPDSFGVFGHGAVGLPGLWTLQPVLQDPGIAAAREITTEESRYFAVVATDHAGIYQSPEVRSPFHARGTVRIRQFKRDAHTGTVVLEGTLTCSERMESHARDLLRLELPLGTETVPCPARLTATAGAGLAAGEARFISVPLALSDGARGRLESTWSLAPFEQVLFEFIPPLSSPCDLYSLGVISLDLLLASRAQALPLVLDELLTLARRAAAEKVAGSDLADWLGQGALLKDHAVLSPRHLWMEPAEAALAGALPGPLWDGIMAWVLRLFTGQGAFAWCSHPGDAPHAALEAIYHAPLADLEVLLFQARALLFGESEVNLELREVIDTVIKMR